MTPTLGLIAIGILIAQFVRFYRDADRDDEQPNALPQLCDLTGPYDPAEPSATTVRQTVRARGDREVA